MKSTAAPDRVCAMETVADTRRFGRWAPLLVVGAGILAYFNSFTGAFVFDDMIVIKDNPEIAQFFPFSLHSRFLVDLTFKLSYASGGTEKVADYHAFNIAIHILAGLLLFGIIRRTLLLPKMSADDGASAAWVAAFSAAIWVAHPLQTESVTYICQRYESMMGMFLLASLYGFIRAQGSARPRVWYDLAIVACACGMVSKEGMIAAPVIIFLYDRFFLAGSFREMRAQRGMVHLALAATSGLLIGTTLLGSAGAMSQGKASFLVPAISPLDYGLNQFPVILHYLSLSVAPVSQCLDYWWPLTRNPADLVFPALVVLTLLGLSVWGFRKGAPAGFAGTWFFVTLAPSSSLVPIADLAFEHRMYLPLASIAVLAVAGLHRLMTACRERWEGCPHRVLFSSVATAATAVLIVLTAQRNMVYRSEESVWADVVAKQPHNLRARNNLAVVLAESRQAEKIPEAIRQLEAVLSLIPGDVRKALESGRLKVIGLFRANTWEYEYFKANANYGLLMDRAFGDSDSAVTYYANALRVAPRHEAIRRALRDVLLRSGETDPTVDAALERIVNRRDAE